jgi:hypothetical protein
MMRLIPLLLLVSILLTQQGAWCAAAATADEEEEESLEALFRHTIAQWRAATAAASRTPRSSNQQRWQPWMAFAANLEKRGVQQQQDDPPQKLNTGNNKKNKKLDIIGAYEEGILAIERHIHLQQQQQQRQPREEDDDDDVARDVTLSQLYTGYAQLLTRLSPDECLQLALDPHTLLIGAANANKKDTTAVPPSNRLCLENAENSARNAIALDSRNVPAHKLLQSILALLVANQNAAKSSADEHNDGRRQQNTEFVAQLFDSFADSFDDTVRMHICPSPQTQPFRVTTTTTHKRAHTRTLQTKNRLLVLPPPPPPSSLYYAAGSKFAVQSSRTGGRLGPTATATNKTE